MKVKVLDELYSSDDLPLMVILTPEDKENIRNMAPENDKYCAYPTGMSQDRVEEFMDTTRKPLMGSCTICRSEVECPIDNGRYSLYATPDWNAQLGPTFFYCPHCSARIYPFSGGRPCNL